MVSSQLLVSLVIIIIIIIIIVVITSVEPSPGGSSPYTSTDKTIKNNVYIEETIPKHSTSDTKHGKYKYTYYQNNHTLQNAHMRDLFI